MAEQSQRQEQDHLTEKSILYRERSHQDAKETNEYARSAAQVTVLINGGAATAVIALAKESPVGTAVAKAMPYALGSYALGVVFGALMMFFMVHSIQRWAIYWEGRVLGYNTGQLAWAFKWGIIWHIVACICFGVAIILFLLGSGAIAVGMIGPK